jgi:hypothetical protein
MRWNVRKLSTNSQQTLMTFSRQLPARTVYFIDKQLDWQTEARGR